MDLGSTLEEWLSNLDLGKYIDYFHNAGLTELDHCSELDDGFLNDIGISQPEHRARLLQSLKLLKDDQRARSLEQSSRSGQDDYINYPANQESEEESIYENVEVCHTKNLPTPCRPAPVMQEVSSMQTSDLKSVNQRKKPVPRPRQSKMAKQQNESLKSSLPNIGLQGGVHQTSIKLDGATNGESLTDDIMTTGQWVEFQDDGKILHGNVKNSEKNVLTVEHNTDASSVIPTENDLSYANTADMAYEPIWMSSSGSRQDEQKGDLHSTNLQNNVAVNSPVSPEAPPPCTTHFPFEGNSQFSFDSSGNSPLSGVGVSAQTSFPSPLASDMSGNSTAGCLTQPECKPPPYQSLSASSDVLLPIREKLDSSSSNEYYLEDNPPPEFPPPPLPQDQRQSNAVSLVDLAEFDPLLAPSLPPVPPRSDINKSDDIYINTSQSATQFNANSNAGIDRSAVYSYAESSFRSQTPPTRTERQSNIYSLAGTPDKVPPFTSQVSTLSSTSGDPFHGDDPFKDDHNFVSECAVFNTEKQEKCVTNENSADYEDFDPFGLRQDNSKLGSVLNEVPPVPHWGQTADVPTTPLYALAQANKSAFESTDESSDDVNSEDPLENGTISPVGSPRSYAVEIRPSSQVERKYERAQYLYKQGGMKGNKGWRKRWVVFTGQSLRYYTNSKSQVSKRIIPLSCMKKVEILVKDTDKDKFKFNLETTNRTFQFAAEALDDCTLWSSTLMAAILKYKPPDGGEREGGDMYDPDKQGYVKFEKQDKRYVAIKQGKLCYYNTEQDFKQASPIHEIELKLASVKDLSKDKLQLSTHYAHFILVFDNYQDCVLWRMAIEEGIATGLGDNTYMKVVLDQVRENPSNRHCADCGNEEAHWASINLGIVLCKKCAGIHRNFNSRLSRVKSLRMDTRIWTPSLIEMMKVIGNENANKFWEKKLSDSERINKTTPPDQRKTYIEDKYKCGKFSDIHAMADNSRLLNEMFLLSAGSSDVLVTMQILFSGANIMFTNSSGENAFQIAKGKGERIQMEFLCQNGGDRLSMGFADTDEALAAKLRSEVCLSGYLMKTGSNMKDFLKRWCIVEHGCLRYYSSEKSSVAKDSIDHESMLLVHATPVERAVFGLKSPLLDVNAKRYQEAFELSTTKDKNNRIYLFAASSVEEKMTWMRTLCKLFCPVPLMEEMGQLDFMLAGSFYVKAGVTSEWEKAWLLMNKKVVQFTDKELKLSEYIDLRKAKNIKRQESVSTCGYCIENGQCIALDIPGRAVYIQGDLRRDTDRLYEAFHKEMKAGGEYLDDQQLTHDDVPIIVDRCIKFIEDNGLFEEGIYRHPGVKSKVQFLIDRFKTDAHAVVLQVGVHNVHEVASCLKQFLRGLKEPLLTTSRYRDWIENAGRQDDTMKLDWYRYLIDYLPPVHNSTLKRLVRHFVKLSEHSMQNKMTRENIAIAFGPSLMETGNDRVQPGSEIPLQMRVIGDIMKFHEQLFKVDSSEKDKEDQIQEAMKKIEEVSRISRVPSTRLDTIKIPVHFLNHSNHSELQEINSRTSARQLVMTMRQRLQIQEGSYVLHESVCNGQITRPLHPSDNVFDIVMGWSNWGASYSNSACLCLKPEQELVQKLTDVYNPTRPLFAELKYVEKKKAAKYAFEFKQSRLSYYKDLKSANVSTPTYSWNIEDLILYYGIDPAAKKVTNKCGLSFMKRGDKPGSKDMPYFGHLLCFPSDSDMLHWLSAMLMAQHPEGLTS